MIDRADPVSSSIRIDVPLIIGSTINARPSLWQVRQKCCRAMRLLLPPRRVSLTAGAELVVAGVCSMMACCCFRGASSSDVTRFATLETVHFLALAVLWSVSHASTSKAVVLAE